MGALYIRTIEGLEKALVVVGVLFAKEVTLAPWASVVPPGSGSFSRPKRECSMSFCTPIVEMWGKRDFTGVSASLLPLAGLF